MLNFAVFFIMIFESTKGNGYDGALVRRIKATFEDCSDLVEAMGIYLGERIDDTRRREEDDLTEDVKGKLRTCNTIFKVVHTFRSASEVLVHPVVYGTIGVSFSEKFFLRAQLSNIGKKIGDILYTASKNGEGALNFHRACDGKGPTIVIAETKSGNVFGGYTDQNWAHKGFRSSQTSFLFSLRPKMKKYGIRDGKQQHAIFSHNVFGPVFGGDSHYNLMIKTNPISKSGSFVGDGYTYAIPSGNVLNDGVREFLLKDYVVLQVKNL